MKIDFQRSTIGYPQNGTTGHIEWYQDWVEHFGNAAPTEGFGLTDNANGTVTIAAGSSVLRDSTDVHTSSLLEYDVPGGTTGTEITALTDNATNYLFANYNSGTPEISVYTSIPVDAGFTEVPIWFLTRIDNDIHVVDMRSFGLNYNVGNAKKDFYVHGFEHAFGSVVTEGSTARSLEVTAGRFYLTSIGIDHSAFDTNTTDGPDTFTLIYSDGGSSWTRVTAQNTISNTLYDDGDGTPGTLAQNDYGIYWVYLVLNTPTELFMMYGNESFATLSAAQSAEIPAILPPEFNAGGGGELIAKVIINESDTNFYEIQSPFQIPLTSQSPTVHNGLGGLDGGSIDEYYHLTSAEHSALSDLHSSDIQIVSNVAIGHDHTIHDYLRHTGSAIPIDGLGMTDNEDGTVTIVAGTAIVRDTTDIHTSTYVEYDVAGGTTGTEITALTDNTTNYLMVDYNSGSPQLEVYTSIPAGVGLTQVPVWYITRVGNELHSIDMRQIGLDHAGTVARKDYNVNFFEHKPGGTLISETGTRNLGITAGTFYLASTQINQPAFDTSGADDFTYIYDNGASGWTRVTAQTTIDNANYDDGDGTLGPLGVNDFGAHWVYLAFDVTTGVHLYVVYGRESYNTLADAQAAGIPSTDMAPEVEAGSNSIFIGKIIVGEGDTNLLEILSPFTQVLGSAVPTSHNGLGGLQGGTTDEYYHLTAAEHAGVIASSYGSMHIDDNTTPQTLNASAGVYDTITAFDLAGPSTSDIGVSTAGNNISVTDAGDYEISFNLSFDGGNDETYHVAVHADGALQNALVFERTMGAGATTGVGACSGIVTLAAADILTLKVASDVAADPAFVAHYGGMTVKRVG